ncbi:MAG: cupin domain-containing protein [Deltaproteobacteria bacterium]|nr:cupin domain-containing protein [Deltaproteobacteria bacterium]
METRHWPFGTAEYFEHPVFSGVRIARLVGGADGCGTSVSLLEISPGTTIDEHVHAQQSDSIMILDGQGEAYVNGTWKSVGAGDYLMVPHGVRHAMRNTGPGVLRLFVTHCPALF